jgi:hypothetical protein
MQYNTVSVNLTLEEAETVLEAFVNWLGEEAESWTNEGIATNKQYRAIIFKLEEAIKKGG